MIGHLQQLHEKYKDKGLVVLGLDCDDTKAEVSQLLLRYGVTYPNIVDRSEEAQRIVFREYQTSGRAAVPLEYIIDRDGKITAGWYGAGSGTGEKALAALGIE